MSNFHITFHPSLMLDISRGEKRCTVRYDWNELPEVGERVVLLESKNRSEIGEAIISAVGKTTIRDFQEHGFPEHTQYQNVEEAVKKFNYFYPNNDFTPETEMDMIWFRVIDDE